MLSDARSVVSGSELDCDVCVVGAGPAGLALVGRLRSSGLRLLLLESGGREPELSTQRLNSGANVGHQYFRLDGCRFRLLGGSSNRWGGWCRPLEPVDFEKREWIPHSGWPIGAEALEPYREETARLFQLPRARFDLAAWLDRLPPPFALAGGDFENTIFQYSPETNFAEAYGDELLSAQNVSTLLHANLVGIELEPGTNRVGRLRVRALGRPPFAVRAKAVVLAAGGIENARILLASRGDRSAGLGNEHGLVGRFFMEHLHVPAGHFVPSDGTLGWDFYRKAAWGDVKVRGVFTPTAAAQERCRLPATSIAMERHSYAFGTPYVGWPPTLTFGPIRLYRAIRRRNERAGYAFVRTLEHCFGVYRRWSTLQASRAALTRADSPPGADLAGLFSLYFRAEQTPNENSRVVLGERRDAFDVPQAQLDWRIAPDDVRSIPTWLSKLDATLANSGLGRVIMPPEGWEAGIIGGPHHMGTTRMSASPREGVVDEHCKIHSADNLYVAGSSVFTTGGYANPTFTLVALALRLADRLRSLLA